MATRREFVQSLPAVGTAFAIGGRLMMDDSPAQAQGAAAPMAGHFHPKGKAPSQFTLDALKHAQRSPVRNPRFEIMPGTKSLTVVAQEDPYEADVGRMIAE